MLSYTGYAAKASYWAAVDVGALSPSELKRIRHAVGH